METIALVLLLLFALAVCGLVLLQRSEGGGLGIGGGGGSAGGRPKASPLAGVTWWAAAGFLICATALTYLTNENVGGNSVLGVSPNSNAGSLLPPAAGDTNNACVL